MHRMNTSYYGGGLGNDMTESKWWEIARPTQWACAAASDVAANGTLLLLRTMK
jgi:hypothetical protein